MKKIVSLMLLCFIMISIMGATVNAALSCNVSMQIEKTDFKKGDEFTVDVNISNIQSDRGVISLGATLEYDKDSLTLVKMEGQNGWETPAVGSSYNESNGKLAITRSGLGKSDETIFKITFKVKDEANKNIRVTLKDISLADGTSPASVTDVYKDITIQEGKDNPNPKPNPSPDGNNTLNNTSDTNNINNNTNTGTTPDKKLPQTGISNIILVVGIVGAILISTICFIKMRNFDKK